MHAVDPANPYEPAGHSEHVAAVQVWQAMAAAETDPVLVEALYWPSAHASHASGVAAPSPLDHVPAGQLEQPRSAEVVPASDPYWPATHAVQPSVVRPRPLEYLPMAHREHAESPTTAA